MLLPLFDSIIVTLVALKVLIALILLNWIATEPKKAEAKAFCSTQEGG